MQGLGNGKLVVNYCCMAGMRPQGKEQAIGHVIVTAEHDANPGINELRDRSRGDLGLMRLNYQNPDVLKGDKAPELAPLAYRKCVIFY